MGDVNENGCSLEIEILKLGHYGGGEVESTFIPCLYSETTSIQGHVPIVALRYIFTSIKRPPLDLDHFFWPKCNTGFTVLVLISYY